MMQTNRKKNTVRYVFATLILSVIFYLNNYKLHSIVTNTNNSEGTTKAITHILTPPTLGLPRKYILLWTNPKNFPFIYLGNDNTVFKERKCAFQNCYVTSDRSYGGLSVSEFDVIAFNGPQLGEHVGRNDLPKTRSVHQKYVYANIEAAIYYPVCGPTWDNYFNWTWTYKLNSDAIWGYLLIRNASNHIIGPGANIDWMKVDDMQPIGDDIKAKLVNKTQAAAWFVSNCMTMSGREKYVLAFQSYISSYNLKVDVYGDCGDFQCPKNIMDRCLVELQRHYYFYFAFENALSDDYVTEKILHALNHYTVPVVFGGANYTRFLPPGSYLDALALGPQILARKVYEIIQKPELYYKFFRWRRYYSYHLRHELPETDDYCNFCAMLNDDRINKSSSYSHFSAWWNPGACQSYQPVTSKSKTSEYKIGVNVSQNWTSSRTTILSFILNNILQYK